MSEEAKTTDETTVNESAPAAEAAKKIDVEATIAQYGGKVDGWIEKGLNLIGDHPWEKWLGVANKYIGTFLPALIALAGVLACVTGLVSAIKYDAPFSAVVSNFVILVVALFSLHLTPKALSLTRSFIEKGEADVIRPEFLYILKVVVGLGGILTALYLICQFNSSALVSGLVVALVAVLFTIVCTRPAIIGVKPDYPKNGGEEALALLIFPLKIVLTLLSLIVGVSVLAALVIGVVKWFSSGFEAVFVFSVGVMLPFLLPLGVYFLMLLVLLTLDLYRALFSLPRKMDEVRKAIEAK